MSRNSADFPEDSGLRRRLSAPYSSDEDENLTSPSEESGRDMRRALTDSYSNPPATADSTMLGRRKSDRAQHVRFSSDVDRSAQRSQMPSPRIGSKKDSVNRPTTSDTSQSGRRPDVPNLSVDTAKASGSTTTLRNVLKTPSSAKSPDSPSNTPITPRSARNRGYSLRRSLFARGINDQVDGASSVIELEEAGPSDLQHDSSTAYRDTHTSKKSRHSSVTINPVFDEEPPPKSDDKVKEGRLRVAALPHYDTWLKEKSAKTRAIRHIQQTFKRAKKFVLRVNEIPPTKNGRHIEIDASRKIPLIDERTRKPYVGNWIRSSRYNVWNFFPRQLLAQFSKLANFYFLCIAILQMIPGLSTTGTYTTIIPLMFFVMVSIGREGYDDYRRYKLDKEENNSTTQVLHAYQTTGVDDVFPNSNAVSPSLGPKHWAKTKWQNLQVGDIVKLERNQPAPADLIILHSTGENGIAYVETMALDGETNLKSKQATQTLHEACDTLDRLAACHAHLVVEDPNLDLYNFEGKVTCNQQTSPLTNGEIIYRGSIIRNTPSISGVVIYSGEECKIRMNANKNARIKAPNLQSLVNKIVALIVLFVLFLAIYNTVAYGIWTENYEQKAWYLIKANVGFGPIIVSFIIMFNTMIPLSLYVSLEIIKVVQMLLLNDIDMYDEESDTPLEARTSTINEELGQISYIFSDKTGTLTDNSMKFRKMSVAGTSWLHDTDLQRDAAKETYKQHLMHKKAYKGKKVKGSRKSYASDIEVPRRISDASDLPLSPNPRPSNTNEEPLPGKWKSSARPAKSQPDLATLEMLLYIQRKPHTLFAIKARFFLLAIALCHTGMPEHREDGTITFQAASPDELALVQAAQEMGYLVIDKSSGFLTIKNHSRGPENEPQIDRYEILDVIEFSSKRKRMSVVVRFPDKRVCVICKGADTFVMQLLKHSAVAMRRTSEIEKGANRRKSLEARQALMRRSEQQEPLSPSIRKSLSTIGRPSIPGLGRKSTSGSRSQPLRNQVDTWLAEREQDVYATTLDEETVPEFTRSSMQQGRPSLAISVARSSLHEYEDFELVEEALVADEAAIVERCFQHINDFATEGLRTLLYAHRFLNEDEYSSWKKIYHDASTSLNNRSEMVEQAGELIERDFDLTGATAIEDKLQKGVPETIDKLRRANIKMWMLTGDKRETAINIGHSCRLIKDYSSVTILDHESGQVEQSIASTIIEISKGVVAHSVVVVDGQTLSMIDAEYSLHKLFLDLAIVADSVICCRASPSQKAGLVKAIRHKLKKSITLAIGDGANDIAMIQEAHVGIGITGKEGLQAARTSDYSIAQFRFLSKLLLVHGRWNYIRTCKYTLATFWKEMMFYLMQALYQRYTGYTGTSLFESWSLSMFNTLFTSLPVIFLGIFEQDLSASTLLAVPELYTKGQHRGAFNVKIYLWWMFLAASDSLLIFFLSLSLFSLPQPLINDVFPFGDLCFTCVIVLVSTKLQFIEMHARSLACVLAFVASVGGWFAWNLLLAGIYGNNTLYDVKGGFTTRFGRDPAWWLALLVILSCVLMLELGVRALKAGFAPSLVDLFRALEKDDATRLRFEQAAALELHAGWEAQGMPRVSDAQQRALQADEEQARAEDEVAQLLALRTREDVDVADTQEVRPNTALDRDGALTRGFGSVKRETLG